MFASQSIPAITVKELGQRLTIEPPEPLQLVDVREPEELQLARVEGFINLPLSQAQQWSEDIYQHLDPETETLVICHHGMRSAQMCQWLIQQGFTNVKNITGGIDAYSVEVDPDIPRY